MSPIGVAEAFERAPLLADRVGEGGDADAIIARARAALAGMSEQERIAVLDAHPRVGTTAGISSRSAAEQGAGMTDPETLRALERLNTEYERSFGFRFVAFVHGRSRAEIVPILRERLGRSREQELATGIDEFLAIARDRMTRG
ncbi:MAG TPA: 2-oxo-4-hydroxy-4-carboxy-5-ureidoimidazoline decarboxylase [Candidatus Limnocylindria bacterium]|nr:2-oxo-4-hydroxy-4-carboxy-5-ureidoimidazoline decarboxylase [Candidatus Limnocylindria bacterium]